MLNLLCVTWGFRKILTNVKRNAFHGVYRDELKNDLISHIDYQELSRLDDI